MARWRVSVSDDRGRARVVLMDLATIAGVISLSWPDYKSAARDGMTTILEVVSASVAESLHNILWRDAQRECSGDTDEAMRRLLSLGWSAERISSVAKELTQHVALALLKIMPVSCST